jgi:hypothetical protein
MVIRIIVAAFLAVLFACDVDARPRRRRSNYRTTNYTTTYATNTVSSWSGSPQGTASTKAQQAASWGTKGHLSGGFGGGNAEGVGFSTYSAQDALNNCCFTGQRTVAGSSVIRGHDGWYAVKIYW